MTKLFFSYSHADELLRDQLEKQLAILKRQGQLETWHDRRIGAGQDFGHEIDAQLEVADIILLLVSADFLASDYCYDIEMKRAIERHQEGEAIVIPVILRPCLWHDTPFGKLRATPTDGKAITQRPDRDQAFLEVAQDVKRSLSRVGGGSKAAAAAPARPAPIAAEPVFRPRSSNLRLAKEYSERDKDAFKHEAFEFIAKFFENSLGELEARNGGIETAFRRIDANRFTAVIYMKGKAAARCTIFMGAGYFENGIAYLAAETNESNTYNKSLSVEADDQTLYLRPMGMPHLGGERDPKLSQEGAAEFLWSMLIEGLQ